MRLLFVVPFLTLLSGSSAIAQIFPTLDPNASSAITKQVAPLPHAAEPADNSKGARNDTPSKSSTPPVSSPVPVPNRAAAKSSDENSAGDPFKLGTAYVLGPQDTLGIHVADMEDIAQEVYPIDLAGYLTLPRIGRVHAAGLSVEQLQFVLTEKFKDYLQEPIVSITVKEFHSQPVSILGAVENPGVHQIHGNKTLYEEISEAGGLKDDAGNKITITRQIMNGPLPLPNAQTDPSGRYSIAELNIRSVMSARNPEENISIKPYDVITVPKADLIYVIGAVKRPGGFPLQERANMTVLEALSLSQGLDKAASSHKAKILRTDEVTHARLEIPIDIQKILEGKGTDQPLLSNDILFIPTSAAKQASIRALEAIIQTGTGIAIYRP